MTESNERFDVLLVEAVRRAQRRYGLKPTGAVGAQTVVALDVLVSARIKQIKANMERWRWLAPKLERNRVQVNIAQRCSPRSTAMLRSCR